jgi:DNA-binding NarL/FixJ family response regulator
MIKTVVLDSNAISRNLLSSVLAGGGYDVVGEAGANSAGIAGMAKLQPQIVCIDIGEPTIDGLDKLDALRAELPKALLFLVSGKLDAASVQGALEHGVQGFIVKPFNASTVLGTIRNAVIKLARQHRTADKASGQAG